MKPEKLTKKELEKRCVEEGILLKRKDPISNAFFYIPNLEKIGIMIKEFDFLVDGASRGKAINEISKIERILFKYEGNKQEQNNVLATNYSKVSIFVESKRELINDRNSENWNYLFVNFFSIEDIFEYFHKQESSSAYFRQKKIFNDMIELNYNLKLMEYLQSQVQLFLPGDDDNDIPFHINSVELSVLILYNAGFIDVLKNNIKTSFYQDGSKLITTLLNLQPHYWKQVHNILVNLYEENEDSVAENAAYNEDLKNILFHYKIDLRRKI